uniref:putative transferase CAF17, mitochondrial n=1 Tax=Euleptes europaea TaxID=460621 RepID=UPI002540BACA|nr:putative transferase CAF17, mitochondrial [Euleptes europaea]
MLVRARRALRGLPCGLRLTTGRGLGGTGAAADCFPLNRALLRLQGRETEAFLQGLLTNDVTRLAALGGAPQEALRAQYAHLLNVQGRCLYDVILYRIHESSQEEAHVLLECDAVVSDSLLKHLKLYKIRRKVAITPCLDLSLWAVIPKEPSEGASRKLQHHTGKAVVVTSDPRVDVMGWRLITSQGTDPLEIVPGSQIGNIKDYHRHRYKQGIPEGIKDLPPGIALPLESNLAYMDGVSFTKGCYIGQELTARTHHMGVIRKRLVPIELAVAVPSESIPDGAEIVTESGKSAGKYRAGLSEFGIALLRLANINEPLRLKLSGGATVNLTASIPKWWPKLTNG